MARKSPKTSPTAIKSELWAIKAIDWRNEGLLLREIAQKNIDGDGPHTTAAGVSLAITRHLGKTSPEKEKRREAENAKLDAMEERIIDMHADAGDDVELRAKVEDRMLRAIVARIRLNGLQTVNIQVEEVKRADIDHVLAAYLQGKSDADEARSVGVSDPTTT